MLHEVDAQHALHADRPTAGAFGIGIGRRNHLGQLFPGNDLVHLGQKLFLILR